MEITVEVELELELEVELEVELEIKGRDEKVGASEGRRSRRRGWR